MEQYDRDEALSVVDNRPSSQGMSHVQRDARAIWVQESVPKAASGNGYAKELGSGYMKDLESPQGRQKLEDTGMLPRVKIPGLDFSERRRGRINLSGF